MVEDKGRRGENTIPKSRCCSDLRSKKTEEKGVGTLFKLSVRELSRELFDTKPLTKQLFFCFTELFFRKCLL
jgi:hypothetical protein